MSDIRAGDMVSFKGPTKKEGRVTKFGIPIGSVGVVLKTTVIENHRGLISGQYLETTMHPIPVLYFGQWTILIRTHKECFEKIVDEPATDPVAIKFELPVVKKLVATGQKILDSINGH